MLDGGSGLLWSVNVAARRRHSEECVIVIVTSRDPKNL